MGNYLYPLKRTESVLDGVAPQLEEQTLNIFGDILNNVLPQSFFPSRSNNNENPVPINLLYQNSIVEACRTNGNCSICRDEIQRGSITRTLNTCNHSFHIACIDRWLAINSRCPLCRQSVSQSDEETVL